MTNVHTRGKWWIYGTNTTRTTSHNTQNHDEVINWKHFACYWPFVRGNSLVTDEFPSQRPVAQSFDVFLICAWINDWVNNCEAGDLRSHHAHYDVTVMLTCLQNVLIGNVNSKQGSFMAISSVQYSHRRCEGRNIPGRHVIANKLVHIQYEYLKYSYWIRTCSSQLFSKLE